MHSTQSKSIGFCLIAALSACDPSNEELLAEDEASEFSDTSYGSDSWQAEVNPSIDANHPRGPQANDEFPGMFRAAESLPEPGAAPLGYGHCGDWYCDWYENVWNCPRDCGYCGDWYCAWPESASTCPRDCGYCGDGLCYWPDDTRNCVSDCGTRCGDGVCNGGENEANCNVDCGPRCGDGLCDGAETASSCRSDCGYCGDGVCFGSETTANCNADCSVCGTSSGCTPGAIRGCCHTGGGPHCSEPDIQVCQSDCTWGHCGG